MLFFFCDFRIGSLCHCFQFGSIRLNCIIPFVGVTNHQKKKKGNPQRIAHRIQCQRTSVSTCINRQCILHSSHVGTSAYPGSIERCGSTPGICTEESFENRIADDKSNTDGKGASQEDSNHTAGQFCQLAEIATKQHNKDHGIKNVVL